MQFSTFPIDDALGVILAHSLATKDGLLKKGRMLGHDDIGALGAAGHRSVMGARLEPGDVTEDEAAARVARAIAGGNVRVAEAFTGRANLFAEAAGVLRIDTGRLLALNRLHEGLTVATLAPYDRIADADMLATIKIITFAVPEGIVAEAETMADGPVLSVAPFEAKTAGLVLTSLRHTKDSVLIKRQRVMRNRLESMGSTLGAVETVAHDTAAVRDAIKGMQGRGFDPILVFAASAITDRGDVIPAALEAAGGQIVHLGMPVDPGNLLMMGELDGRDVIGVPSCAGSPKLNGFDWVLERRLAGIAVGSDELTAMCVGGLLKEISSRPQPREGDI